MKMPGVLLLLLFPLALFLAAQSDEAALPSVFDGPVPECNCTLLLGEINATRAIAITQMKFKLRKQTGWLESGMEYVDKVHAELTQTIHVFSANADRQLAVWAGDDTLVKPTEETPREGNASEGMSDYFNRLFHDTTYLNSGESSYLIVRGGFETNKEAGPSFPNSVRFAVKLPRTQKRLQLYVGDPTSDEEKQAIDQQGGVDSGTTVGLRYYVPDFLFDIKTSFSSGIRGVTNPFVQARFEYPVNFYDWRIRPVQYFDYSVDREFYEETDLYFDRRISTREMVRLQLQRSTQTHNQGTAYGTQLSYFNSARRNTGLLLFLSMSGETVVDEGRYENPKYSDVNPGPGIYLYSVGGRWKASFFRKWLFYELDSRVDFDMVYNWRPNYVNQIWIEFYFGDV